MLHVAVKYYSVSSYLQSCSNLSFCYYLRILFLESLLLLLRWDFFYFLNFTHQIAQVCLFLNNAIYFLLLCIDTPFQRHSLQRWNEIFLLRFFSTWLLLYILFIFYHYVVHSFACWLITGYSQDYLVAWHGKGGSISEGVFNLHPFSKNVRTLITQAILNVDRKFQGKWQWIMNFEKST